MSRTDAAPTRPRATVAQKTALAAKMQGMVRHVLFALCAVTLGLESAREVFGVERIVSTTAQLSAALAAAAPGDEIVLQPGVYGGGHFRANLSQVTIRSF